MIEDLG